MGSSISAWIQRLHEARKRIHNVAALRTRLKRSPGPNVASDNEVRLALEMRGLRKQIVASMSTVESCGTCARGRPWPHGRWHGGFCCGGSTDTLFSEDEVASLKQAGTRPHRLTILWSDSAGCDFRGPTGCALSAEDRPNICTRYCCQTLRTELRRNDALGRVEALSDRLLVAFNRFVQVRGARIDEERFWDALGEKGSEDVRRRR